ncbi:MAG: sigma-54-dependent Fis family transcriptional regulator [Candidatus Liberibacter ctenarytainae]|uniref:Sigma-54-dependent Fis family transcriptional regulator n=1 Tax=Candidatus Liberibacter ctenarytainae TaxID=2020335 RepID=A0A937ACR2_9HYPH|nr:sigma-54-dependent Fis family transcriptional regulator [Candidatus Liberibacter ctenarytainae]
MSSNDRTNLLIIDKDHEQCKFLKLNIEERGYNVIFVNSLEQCFNIFTDYKIDVIFISLIKFDDDQEIVSKHIIERIPCVPVIIQTQQSDLRLLICSLYNRINRFCFAPLSKEQMVDSICSVLESRIFTSIQDKVLSLDSLIAVSSTMIQTLNLARRSVECVTPLMIEGEVGTGKKTLAYAIHASGSHASFPFITLNCQNIDPNKIENVLFGDLDLQGYMRYPGKFVEAKGGALLLEEAHSLPLTIQEKIFQFIETGKIEYGNSCNTTTSLDVRLIFSTRNNWRKKVDNQTFLKELYYKISAFSIHIPALRDRREDIPALAQFFLNCFCMQHKVKNMSFSEGALSALTTYNWPDNILELENTILQSAMIAEDFQIGEDDLPSLIFWKQKENTRKKLKDSNVVPMTEKGQIFSHSNDVLDSKHIINSIGQNNEIRRLFDVEEEMITLAIQLYRGHMSEIARRLGIGRSTLYRKIKEYNIDVNS